MRSRSLSPHISSHSSYLQRVNTGVVQKLTADIERSLRTQTRKHRNAIDAQQKLKLQQQKHINRRVQSDPQLNAPRLIEDFRHTTTERIYRTMPKRVNVCADWEKPKRNQAASIEIHENLPDQRKSVEQETVSRSVSNSSVGEEISVRQKQRPRHVPDGAEAKRTSSRCSQSQEHKDTTAASKWKGKRGTDESRGKREDITI